jgi:hypothetical protein
MPLLEGRLEDESFTRVQCALDVFSFSQAVGGVDQGISRAMLSLLSDSGSAVSPLQIPGEIRRNCRPYLPCSGKLFDFAGAPIANWKRTFRFDGSIRRD